MVEEAKQKQLEEGNEEAREEVSKQINKAIVDDWNFQRELKRRENEAFNLSDHSNAVQDNQVNQETLEQESLKMRNLELQRQRDRQMELSNRDHVRFQEQLLDNQDKDEANISAGREKARIEAEDQYNKEREAKAKAWSKESLESQVALNQKAARESRSFQMRTDAFKDFVSVS